MKGEKTMNIAAYEDRKRYRQGCLPGALGAVPMLIAYAGMPLFSERARLPC